MFTVIYAMEITAFAEALTNAGKLHCRTPFVEHLLVEHVWIASLKLQII